MSKINPREIKIKEMSFGLSAKSENLKKEKQIIQQSKRQSKRKMSNSGLNMIIGSLFNRELNKKMNYIQQFSSEEKLNQNIQIQIQLEDQGRSTPSLLQKQKKIILGSINSLAMLNDNRIYNLLDKNLVLTTNSNGEVVPLNYLKDPSSSKQKKVTCKCRKTKCLKLYCDCFQNGNFCNEDCNCQSCQNKTEFKDLREQARVMVQERNQGAFFPKIICGENENDEEVYFHNKGCNCKKSGCQKKYCECFNQGVQCQASCKCEDCKNVPQIKEEFEHSQNKRLTHSKKMQEQQQQQSLQQTPESQQVQKESTNQKFDRIQKQYSSVKTNQYQNNQPQNNNQQKTLYQQYDLFKKVQKPLFNVIEKNEINCENIIDDDNNNNKYAIKTQNQLEHEEINIKQEEISDNEQQNEEEDERGEEEDDDLEYDESEESENELINDDHYLRIIQQQYQQQQQNQQEDIKEFQQQNQIIIKQIIPKNFVENINNRIIKENI